jgi:chloramphenicol 3-O phosphotransferase
VTAPRDACRTSQALPAEPTPGWIILLNGTSSSGKSSIAKELLHLLEGPNYHLAVDAFNAMREQRRDLSPEALADVLYRMRRGFHRAIAGMAAGGNNVVVDHVLSEPWRLADCLEVFTPFDVVFVGVRCSADELERRERERGDRPTGLAAQQLGIVHAHGFYDIECDTTRTSPHDCARQIKDALQRGTTHTAFEKLRAALPTPTGTRASC